MQQLQTVDCKIYKRFADVHVARSEQARGGDAESSMAAAIGVTANGPYEIELARRVHAFSPVPTIQTSFKLMRIRTWSMSYFSKMSSGKTWWRFSKYQVLIVSVKPLSKQFEYIHGHSSASDGQTLSTHCGRGVLYTLYFCFLRCRRSDQTLASSMRGNRLFASPGQWISIFRPVQK